MTRHLVVGDLQFGAGEHFATPQRTRLEDQRAMWTSILDVADEHRITNLLLLGDVFQRRHPSPNEYLAFQEPLSDFVNGSNVSVVVISGNHDVTNDTARSSLEVLADVSAYRTPAVHGGVAVLPWTAPHRLAASSGREQINERVAAHLVECAREMREMKWKGFDRDLSAKPDVLALHWAISGSLLASGVETIDLPEPVLPLQELKRLGYKAIVGGHIHRWQVLNAADPLVLVAGSPWVCDWGETGFEHGVWILDVDDEGARAEFVQVLDRPFVTLNLHPRQLRGGFDLSPDAADFAGAIVRVRYSATEDEARNADHQAIMDRCREAGAYLVTGIEATILREQRARAEVTEQHGPLEALDMWTDAQGEEFDVAVARSLREACAERLATT